MMGPGQPYYKLQNDQPSPPNERADEDDKYDKLAKQFKMRAVSFESYAFISALLFGFACMAVKWDNGDYTVFRDAQLSREEDEMLRHTNDTATEKQKVKFYLSDNYQADLDTYEIIFLVHMLIMTVCCSLSIYATMIFSMAAVYLRTGLAIGRLDALSVFLDDCSWQRNCAFKAFLLGAALLPCDIILVTFANLLQHGHGIVYILVLLCPASFVALLMGAHIRAIMTTASNTVFAPVAQKVGTPGSPEELFDEPPAEELAKESGERPGRSYCNCVR